MRNKKSIEFNENVKFNVMHIEKRAIFSGVKIMFNLKHIARSDF